MEDPGSSWLIEATSRQPVELFQVCRIAMRCRLHSRKLRASMKGRLNTYNLTKESRACDGRTHSLSLKSLWSKRIPAFLYHKKPVPPGLNVDKAEGRGFKSRLEQNALIIALVTQWLECRSYERSFLPLLQK